MGPKLRHPPVNTASQCTNKLATLSYFDPAISLDIAPTVIGDTRFAQARGVGGLLAPPARDGDVTGGE